MPKPLHGWREFAGEVGIIVIGVLIALSAEQAVEAAHWRASVAAAKESLDAELTEAHKDSLELIIDHGCIKRRLDHLETLVEAGAAPPNTYVHVFGLRQWSTATWEAASSSGAVAHMSSDDTNRYANEFGLVRVIGGLAMKAYDASNDVSTLDRPHKLTDVSRDRLESDLAKLRSLNQMLALGAKQFVDLTKDLQLHLSVEARAELARERTYEEQCPMPVAPASDR